MPTLTIELTGPQALRVSRALELPLGRPPTVVDVETYLKSKLIQMVKSHELFLHREVALVETPEMDLG